MTVTWIFDFDYDFTIPQEIAKYVKEYVVLPQESVILDWPKISHPCIAYGTMRKLSQILRQPNICEAVFDNYISLRCSSYYRFIYDLLGRTIIIVPFSALLHIDWNKMFGDKIFIRPDGNHKPFEAEIVQNKDLRNFVQRYQTKYENELIVVSEVVHLGKEYRCFCRDGKVFCHSSYPESPYEPAPLDVISFAEKVAMRLMKQGLSMITVDVAKETNLRIVEIGGVNSWGIYGGNISDFVREMELEAIKRYNEIM